MAGITDKNDPGRFLGEGVAFRAKLIGVLEVPEARGDRMCQEALADLKMAIRAAGEHKQRIQVHVAIDGLRLRDDKTGDSLYHHPVHKISFIAQDMTDSRAFGYIFGSPDTGHRFFGIKTDKAASQVVIAMRDLFQVVFELKKKEIELAKQQLQDKSITSALSRHSSSAADSKMKTLASVHESTSSISKPESSGEGGVAELVDLEQELSSLRRGLTQVEGLTPSNDPFGDSFVSSQSQKGLLPPPPPSGSSTRGRNTPGSSRSVFSPSKSPAGLPFDLTTVAADFDATSSNITSSSALRNIGESELKNPPKKVLKDLVPTTQSLISDLPIVTTVESRTEEFGPTTTMTSLSRQSGGTVSIAKPSSGGTIFSGNFFSSDPFADTDPFDSADPFPDLKEDPFISMQEFPKNNLIRADDMKSKRSRDMEKMESIDSGKSFNGPLQVTLPPEPLPKSPRLHRQMTDTNKVRQRPQAGSLTASPPPPLPPKKIEVSIAKPPPRPPHDHEEEGPPLPAPQRKAEPLQANRSTKPRLSSAATNSSEDEYLAPAPPPLPSAKRFDITLSQLLTLSMDELAARLRVSSTMLSSMTLPQLTEYLRSYLAADNDRAHIHSEPSAVPNVESKPVPPLSTTIVEKSSMVSTSSVNKFKAQFEDDFAPTDSTETFVANFDDFDKKVNSSYDRYAAFREIQEQELKSSILAPVDNSTEEDKQDSEDKQELAPINNETQVQEESKEPSKVERKSPLKSLDELTVDSFNRFKHSVSPKPTHIDAKIEDIKSMIKNMQLEQSRRSVSPREPTIDKKDEDKNDRYAALREITITEAHDEFESLPPEIPKERKRSDEKSDGFDNSDFFDCIDNSSLSISHVEDAFRKSPIVKSIEEDKKVEIKKESPLEPPVREPVQRLSTGSISDVASGSSPDTKDKQIAVADRSTGRWSMLGGGWSSDSRDSPPAPPLPAPAWRRRHSPHDKRQPIVQTSSSSRDVSPWDEEPPHVRRPPSHHHRDRDRDSRESRHNSSGSRECLDSGSGREKDKIREKHVRNRERERKDSGSRRDSGSSRDRRDELREPREHKERRDRRSRDRDRDKSWDRDRNYSRDRDYRDSRSRDRSIKDYREKDRDRHRKSRHSYDEDEEDYSDGCGSGRSSPRERWADRWRRDERIYGSLGWRESRRRVEARQPDDANDRRYGSTLGWPGRRSTGSSRRESDRDTGRESRDSGRDTGRESRDSGRELRDSLREFARDGRELKRRSRKEEKRPRDYRFSNDFSPREREEASPFDNDYQDTPTSGIKKRAPYSSLEAARFAFESEEVTASPMSVSSARARDGDSPATRFRFDSDSVSPRSMFEDDFTTISTPRGRAASIAEEDEGDIPPLRSKPPNQHRDIKKSESINIFTRESDPFENDDFFACTGSDKVARRENWPGDFQEFENA